MQKVNINSITAVPAAAIVAIFLEQSVNNKYKIWSFLPNRNLDIAINFHRKNVA